MNLKQVALRLGVHYTTVYRYVRTHQLDADRVATGWVVSPSQLDRFLQGRDRAPERRRRVDWPDRLRPTLERGDEVAAWRVIEDALRSGVGPEACYLDVLGGALSGLDGSGDHVDSYLASAVALRLVARLGARFRRPGRTRGTVIVAAPSGEQHALSIAILADLVRLRGVRCVELGVDVPADVVAAAAGRESRLRLVALGVNRLESSDAVAATASALRASAPGVPLLVGGQGVRNAQVAAALGADHWAPDLRGALAVVDELVDAPARSSARVAPGG
jgi:methanogenic corrinoid protein MtbC1